MTFLDFKNRLLKNWWIILLTIVASNIFLLPKTNDPVYLASTTVGININNPQFQSVATSQNSNLAANYDALLKEFSLYLTSRYQSPDIQTELAKRLEKQVNIDLKKPFYSVNTQSAGFVNVSLSVPNEGEAVKFNNAVIAVYDEVILQEWNKNRPSLFTIENSDKSRKFTSTYNKNQPLLQMSALPSLVGVLCGIAIALIFPTFSKKM
jgi:hypothetical protein